LSQLNPRGLARENAAFTGQKACADRIQITPAQCSVRGLTIPSECSHLQRVGNTTFEGE
jgi:hypothetical protein